MKYYELFKKTYEGDMIICGHLSSEEYKFYLSTGYKKKPTEQVNKSGIKVI